MKGPEIKLYISCSECDYCKSVRYYCQGDSGHDVTCTLIQENNYIGDSRWSTPEWCPLRKELLLNFLNEQLCLIK